VSGRQGEGELLVVVGRVEKGTDVPDAVAGARKRMTCEKGFMFYQTGGGVWREEGQKKK